MARGPLAAEGCAVPTPHGTARSSAPCSLLSRAALCAGSTCIPVLLQYLPQFVRHSRYYHEPVPRGPVSVFAVGCGIGLESTFEPLQGLEADGGTRGASRARVVGLRQAGIYFS